MGLHCDPNLALPSLLIPASSGSHAKSGSCRLGFSRPWWRCHRHPASQLSCAASLTCSPPALLQLGCDLRGGTSLRLASSRLPAIQPGRQPSTYGLFFCERPPVCDIRGIAEAFLL